MKKEGYVYCVQEFETLKREIIGNQQQENK